MLQFFEEVMERFWGAWGGYVKKVVRGRLQELLSELTMIQNSFGTTIECSKSVLRAYNNAMDASWTIETFVYWDWFSVLIKELYFHSAARLALTNVCCKNVLFAKQPEKRKNLSLCNVSKVKALRKCEILISKSSKKLLTLYGGSILPPYVMSL